MTISFLSLYFSFFFSFFGFPLLTLFSVFILLTREKLTFIHLFSRFLCLYSCQMERVSQWCYANPALYQITTKKLWIKQIEL